MPNSIGRPSRSCIVRSYSRRVSRRKIGAWDLRQRGPTVLLREPGRHQLAVFLLESRCLLGRHVAELEPVDHVAPMVAIVALDEIGIELVDPQLPLGLFDAVTGVAMLLKERLRPGRRGSTRPREAPPAGILRAEQRTRESTPAQNDSLEDVPVRVGGLGGLAVLNNLTSGRALD